MASLNDERSGSAAERRQLRRYMLARVEFLEWGWISGRGKVGIVRKHGALHGHQQIDGGKMIRLHRHQDGLTSW